MSRTSGAPDLGDVVDLLRQVAEPASWEDPEQTRREAAELLRRIDEHGFRVDAERVIRGTS